MVIETLHLDAEGGVGERRTARPDSPPPPAVKLTEQTQSAVVIEIDGSQDSLVGPLPRPEVEAKSTKPKKGVAFRLDRPDLYEF
jgi:elongator complex protein 4